jgi:hypothetical protein
MKTIVCDVDNCILDFSYTFSQWLKTKNIIIDENPQEYNMGLINDVRIQYVNEFWSTEHMMKIRYMYDAISIINNLSKKFIIRIVTAIPSIHEKRRIINLLPVQYHSLECNENKYKIIEDIKPDYCIEDSPEIIIKNSNNYITTFMPIWNYNKDLMFLNSPYIIGYHKNIFWNKVYEYIT